MQPSGREGAKISLGKENKRKMFQGAKDIKNVFLGAIG
jgi:hypothetical protein